MWAYESVFYQIYPLGFCGAPFENDGVEKSRILKVKEWIPHIRGIGADAIYFSPVFESDTHGYNTRDFRKIDCRLGSNEDFAEVCRSLHEAGIRVVLDGVFNHVGRGFWAFQDVLKNRENSPYLNWFHINLGGNSNYNDGLWYEGWEGNYDLVKLNLKNETDLKTLGNIVPDCWIYVQDVGVKLGRIQIFNNWSPYLVKDPDHTVWIGLEYFCTEGDKYWNMSEEEWVKFGIAELIKMGVITSERDVLDSHREKVKKAYPAYFDTYAQIDDLIAYLDTFENLYCVGRNGQHRYNNMDHSMATSFEAVGNILSGRRDKKNIWSVNTEKEYHEVKK